MQRVKAVAGEYEHPHKDVVGGEEVGDYVRGAGVFLARLVPADGEAVKD